jgi:hypothetical protein
MGTERRWRLVALLAIGILIGLVVAGTPAGAHVGGTVSHLWNTHLKPKADTRYANAVSGTDKAKNADEVDGLDSTRFARVVASGTATRDFDPIGSLDCTWFTINPAGVGDISDDVVLAVADNIPNGQVVVDTFQVNSTESFNIRLCNFLGASIDPAEATFFWIILRMP